MFDFLCSQMYPIFFPLVTFLGFVVVVVILKKSYQIKTMQKIPLFSSGNVFFIFGSSSFAPTRIGVCFKV